MSDKSAFDGLIDDLKAVDTDTETMAKAMEDKGGAVEGEGADKDDGEIAEAAAEADADKDDAEGDDKSMAKSFRITLEDGTEVEAVDGGEMIKSLIARIEKGEAVTTAAVDVIKNQSALIKSLSDKVGALSAQAKPRKAVLAVTEKPSQTAEELAKSQAPGTISSDELMAKAMSAMAAGRVTSLDVAVAEQEIQMGQQPSAAFVRAVIGA